MSRKGPNTKASVTALLPSGRLRFEKPQGEPVAAAPAVVVHAVCEAAHQMNAEVAGRGVLEGSRHRRRGDCGRIELPPVVLDASRQRAVLARQLDRDLQPAYLGAAMHDDV